MSYYSCSNAKRHAHSVQLELLKKQLYNTFKNIEMASLDRNSYNDLFVKNSQRCEWMDHKTSHKAGWALLLRRWKPSDVIFLPTDMQIPTIKPTKVNEDLFTVGDGQKWFHCRNLPYRRLLIATSLGKHVLGGACHSKCHWIQSKTPNPGDKSGRNWAYMYLT